MNFEGIIVGLVFIILGFLVKAFPNLLAGYNTMTKEQKVNVDVQGLTSWARKCLVGIGVVLIVAGIVLPIFNRGEFDQPIFASVVIIGVVVLIAGAQKFDKN